MEALVNNIIKATGWSIFHSLWQGAFLYGLLVLIFLMIPALSARAKHNMAYGTICLMFIGFCGTFFSLFTWPPLSTVTQTLSLSKVIPSTVNYQTEHYFPLLVSLYVTGLLLQLAVLSTGYYKLLKLKNSLKLAVPQEWQALFQRMTKDFKISNKVGLYLSHHVNVPLVIGFIKPVILFPVSFATQLDLVHVEAILIHELAHIRRNDYLLNIMKTVMETILFFNPFTWLCSNLIQREREHACDDQVVHKTHTPLTYAHALLQIELLKEKQTPAFSMAAGGDNQHLYQRIKRITDMKTTYSTAKQQLFAIGITIATLVSLAWVNPLKTETTVKKEVNVHKVISPATIALYQVEPQQDTTKKKKAKTVTKKTKDVKGKNTTVKEPPVRPAPPAPPAPPIPPAPVNTPEFTKRIEKIKQHFNSPEWKKQQAEIEKRSAEIQKRSIVIAQRFNSPEWKNRQAEIEKRSAEIQKRVNSPEFKKRIAEIEKHSIVIAKHFNSPEWKKHQAEIEKMGADMQKHFNSPEFKRKIEKQVEICTEIKTDALEKKIENDVQVLENKMLQEPDKK